MMAGGISLSEVTGLLDIPANLVLDGSLWVRCRMGRRNLVPWTSIVSGFAMHGLSVEALELFAEMRRAGIRPNRVTFLSVVDACSHGGLVKQGLAFFQKSMVL